MPAGQKDMRIYVYIMKTQNRREFGQQMRSVVYQMAYFLIPDAIWFIFGPFLRDSTRV